MIILTAEIISFISQVGFPIFVSVYLLYYFKRSNEQMVSALHGLTQTFRERPCLKGEDNHGR